MGLELTTPKSQSHALPTEPARHPRTCDFLKSFALERLGGSVGSVSALGSGCDPGVLGLSPMSGSLLSGDSVSPSSLPGKHK